MFEHEAPFGGQMTDTNQQGRLQIDGIVRRIKKDQIEVAMAHGAQEIATHQRALIRHAAVVDVAPGDGQGLRGQLEDGGGSGPATERFERDGGRSAEPVQHAGADDRRPEDVEQRFAKAIGRRTHRETLRRHKPPPFQTTGDDAHGSAHRHQTEALGPVLGEVGHQGPRLTAGIKPRDGRATRIFHQAVVANQIADAKGG